MSYFELPLIYDCPNSWGPGNHIPNTFKDTPFTPFNKNEAIGKVIDWEVQAQSYVGRGKFQSREQQQQLNSSETNAFAYREEEDESSFQVVDNKLQKPRPNNGILSGRKQFLQQRRQQTQSGPWQQRGRGGSNAASRGGRSRVSANSGANQRQYQQNRGFQAGGRSRYERIVKPREASIEVKRSWKVIKTYNFADFNKISADPIPEATDIGMYGKLERYDVAIDSITSKSAQAVRKFENRQFFSATPSVDPVIQQLATAKTGTIYASDVILALLLSASKSVYSWDIIITKSNGTLTLDKRQKSTIDFWTVGETGNEQGLQFDTKEDGSFGINHPTALAAEATFINQNFSQQVLPSRKGFAEVKASDILAGEKPNPFIDQLDGDLEASSIAFRYRKWNLQNKHVLVARTELNAFSTKKQTNENQYLLIKALTEFDSKACGTSDYRQKLDTQSASVFASELKNNCFKLSRWAAQAVLSGADELKLGYISRNFIENPNTHSIIGVQKVPTARFVTQVGLDVGKMWGFLRSLFDNWMNLEDGKYLLLKEPTEAKLTLYALPNSFSLEDDEVEEDD